MTTENLETRAHPNGISEVILDRPEVHNAFDDTLIERLDRCFEKLSGDENCQVVILKGRGKSFSAGADLGWMKRMAGYSFEENHADAKALAQMLNNLNNLPQTTIGLLHGAVMGGGVGLACCVDIAISADTTKFALSETRLGLVPAVISPYVVAAIGARQSRRYMQTAERFDASTAQQMGLVHEVVPADTLEQRGEKLAQDLLKCGPEARRVAKQLVFNVQNRKIDDMVVEYTTRTIASVRATDEGREGVAAFLEKRRPRWGN